MEKEIKKIQYTPGSAILLEDSRNEGYFYILKSGIVNIQSEVPFYEKYFSKYHAGDTFGLVSGLTRNTSRYTLITETECEVIRIPITMLGKYFHENKDICLKIISLYSNQLRLLNNYLIKKNTFEKDIENPAKLSEIGQKYANAGQTNLAAHCLHAYIKWAENNQPGSAKKIEEAKVLLKKIAPDFKIPVIDTKKLTFNNNDVIFVENEPADFFYIIEKGAIKISKLVNDREFILCILRDGEIFGEMSILDNRVRNASAVAFEESNIMKLSVDTFMDSVGKKLLFSIFESLARRIWYAHKRVSLLDMSDPNAMLYTYLQILVSDINSKNKSWDKSQKEFIFAFTLNDLKKMIGIADLKDDLIHEFLSDNNIDISNHIIRIKDRRKVDDKVAIYYNRHRKKQSFDLPT